MKKKRTEFIDEQRTRMQENLNESTSDSNSPYSRYTAMAGKESAQANPDILADTTENHLWGEGNKPELAQLIIERFADSNGSFPILTKRQNEVLRLYLLGMEARAIALELNRDLRNIGRTLKQISKKFQRLLKSVDL